MKKGYTIFIAFLICMLCLAGCKSRKPKADCTQKLGNYPKNVLTEVSDNLATFEYLSLRVKANYSQGDNSNSFAMNIKMQKDSFVWVSVVAVIEVARAYITTDSFKLIDRINRKYYMGAIADLKQFTGQDLSLVQLQNMLIANPLYAVDAFQKSNDELRNDHLKYQSSGLVNRVQLSGCFRSMTTVFSSVENANKVEVDYANFTKEKDIGYLPQQVTIEANGDGKRFTFLMDYSSIGTSPFDPIIFKIPSRYEKGN